MAIIGWICCVLFMCYLTATAGLVSFNCAGDFNIGGAPNSIATKIKACLFMVVVLIGWYFIAITFPFTIGAV